MPSLFKHPRLLSATLARASMQHMHGNQGVLVPQDARIATGVASEDRQPADEDDASKDSADEASDHTAD